MRARLLGLIALALPAIMPLSGASAADKSDGCGIGNYITDKATFSGTTTRGTTHYFLPPTFSMTSGTSGCAQHSIVKADRRGEHLVESSYDRLREEAAQGGGEFVSAFTAALGCSSHESGAAAAMLQLNYDGVFGSGEAPAEVVTRARQLLRLGSCGAV